MLKSGKSIIVTNHCIDRFNQYFPEKCDEKETKRVIQRLLLISQEDRSVLNTARGFVLLDKYPNERLSFFCSENVAFVVVGTGWCRRAVTCYPIGDTVKVRKKY